MNTKTCFIFGACGLSGNPLPGEGDFVIAADGGLKTLERLKITPDLTVGDFDSLGYIPDGDNVVRHPVMKDDTDTMLAIRLGLEKGYKNFEIYGGVGGRLDHTIANLQALCFISRRGGSARLIGDGIEAYAVTNGKLCFSKEKSGTVSVFCFGEDAKGVYLRGLKYPLTDAVLTADFPLGVSNEFIGKDSEIEVRCGTLAVICTQ